MSDGDGAAPSVGNGPLLAHGATAAFDWALRSEPGEMREHNEDFVGAFVPDADDLSRTPGRGPFFVVCDGLGGHAAGEVASRTAVEAALASWTASRPGGGHQAARAAARAANLAVYDASLTSGRRGMATTMTALTLTGREAVLAHVGDSRAFLVRDGVCSQLTADHSRVGEMLRMGLIDAEQAAVHPGRSQLTRTIGSDLNVQVDVVRTPTEPDDVFVLCSDGLWDVVSRHEIAETVATTLGPPPTGPQGVPAPPGTTTALADLLVNEALARQSPDNVSVLAVRVTTDQTFSGGEPRRSRRRWGRR